MLDIRSLEADFLTKYIQKASSGKGRTLVSHRINADTFILKKEQTKRFAAICWNIRVQANRKRLKELVCTWMSLGTQSLHIEDTKAEPQV